MTLRILHILDHSIPLQSGYSFRTLSILREQRALGWRPTPLTTPRQGASDSAQEYVDGSLFLRTPVRRGILSRLPLGSYVEEMRATARRIEEIVCGEKPDILHPHSPVLNALPALWVGRKHGIPVVYEMRASWEDAAVDHGSTEEGSMRYRLSRSLETFALRHADQITTICDGLRYEILSRGIDSSKVTVIPNAVAADQFGFGVHPDSALKAQLGLGGATVLGFAGSFYGYEGLDLLLNAAAMLVSSHRELKVLLIGGGPQEGGLKAQAGRLGLGERVIFAGRIPHGDVSRYYNLIDVLAYPRYRIRLTEMVTPLKPLEAMAQGRIVVASDVGGHRELIRDGETGFLFPAGDASALAHTIERVLDRRGDWPMVADRARRFIECERTWANSVGRYWEVYQRALRIKHPNTQVAER